VLRSEEPGTPTISHVFRSKDKKWSVSLRAGAFALETTKYATFEYFKRRFFSVVHAVLPLLDTDFFTRVGLRYINVLPVTADGLNGWVNRELVGPLFAGVLGQPTRYWQEVRGFWDGGQYSFRHGLDPNQATGQHYQLDFDFFDENVEAAHLDQLVVRLHDEGYKFFMWSVGQRAKDYMNSVGQES
jgi:uncharacterized protein (TIGR04255 family)